MSVLAYSLIPTSSVLTNYLVEDMALDFIPLKMFTIKCTALTFGLNSRVPIPQVGAGDSSFWGASPYCWLNFIDCSLLVNMCTKSEWRERARVMAFPPMILLNVLR